MSCPLLVSNFFIPRIIWCQSDITVIVRILLIDVRRYYLRVESNCLCFRYLHVKNHIYHGMQPNKPLLYFSTTVNDKHYYLILHLFGPVKAEKTVHKNLGREIKICLTKELKCIQYN